MEGDKFTRIPQADYISYSQQQSGESKVRAALETKEMFVCWVQQVILRCDELAASSGLLKFIVSTAEVGDILKLDTAHVTWTDRHFHRNLVNSVISRPCCVHVSNCYCLKVNRQLQSLVYHSHCQRKPKIWKMDGTFPGPA